MNKQKFIKKIDPLFLEGIAHRGLFDNVEITENSLNAFLKAKEMNFPIEIDAHLTKDNELVICHDEDLIRTTGKAGIIEHLTLKEIQDNYRLLDGQKVPTLAEVFELINDEIPIVLELKVFEKNYRPLAKRVKQELDKYVKDKSRLLLISFDPRSLWPFSHRGYMRSLLIAKQAEFTYKYRVTLESIDIEQVFFSEKRVKKYAKKHFVNTWTITNEEELEKVLPYVDTVTFEAMDPLLVRKKLQEKHKK